MIKAKKTQKEIINYVEECKSNNWTFTIGHPNYYSDNTDLRLTATDRDGFCFAVSFDYKEKIATLNYFRTISDKLYKIFKEG